MSENEAGSGPDASAPSLPSLIEEALTRRDRIALQNKGKRLTFAVTAAGIGPFAVFLLELHVVYFSTEEYRYYAIGLILLELFTLGFALSISFLRLDQSHYRWLAERLRTELLRREKFLLFAGVGPYLGAAPSIIALKVERRLATIDDDINDAFALLRMGEHGATWRDALDDARCAAALAEIPTIATDLNNYLHGRVVSQRTWYARKSTEHAQHTWWLEGGSKITLMLAIIVAAIHLGYHGAAVRGEFGARPLTVIAVLLPALGAALIGLLSIFGCRRLSRSYLYHAHALERLENALRALQTDVVQANAQQKGEISFQFRRILLETEELLSNELRLWWLYMQPEAPRAAA